MTLLQKGDVKKLIYHFDSQSCEIKALEEINLFGEKQGNCCKEKKRKMSHLIEITTLTCATYINK